MNRGIAFVWDCPNCGLDQREIQTTDGPWIDLECSYCGKTANGKLNDRSRLASSQQRRSGSTRALPQWG